MTAASIAKAILKGTGFTVQVELSKNPEMEDDAVYVTKHIHISVGCCGASVVAESADKKFTFYPERRTMKEIFKDLDVALTKDERRGAL